MRMPMRHMHIAIILEVLRFMGAPPFRIRVFAGFKAIIAMGFALVNTFPKDLHSAQEIVRVWGARTFSENRRILILLKQNANVSQMSSEYNTVIK